MRTSGETDEHFRLKLKNNLSGIDVSQPTPSLSLSVPLKILVRLMLGALGFFF